MRVLEDVSSSIISTYKPLLNSASDWSIQIFNEMHRPLIA